MTESDAPSAGRPPRVLVVEDAAPVRELVVRGLVSEGFVVDQASTVAQARRQLAAAAPDVVLLDVGLPDASGLQLLREIVAASGPPVIILSSGRPSGPARSTRSPPRSSLAELREALAKGDIAATADLAHNIKGTSATYGAARLARLCGELEQVAEDGDLASSRLLAGLEGEFERVRAALRSQFPDLAG